MNNESHVEEVPGESEQTLNPSPYQYRVSFKIKAAFLLLCVLGLAGYFYMVIERRIAQGQYLLRNQMAAVSLVKSSMPAFYAYDPVLKTEAPVAAEPNTWMMLNLWATWCPPCREEMPKIELLQQKFKGKLNVVALSVDDDIDAVLDFIKTNKPSFKVLWDKEKASLLRFGVSKYPETFLISPDGQITTQFSGPRDWSSAVSLDYFADVLRE